MNTQDKVILEQDATPERIKKINVPYSEKAKANLHEQQRRYMRKHGEAIRLDDLAGMLLETAVLK